MPADKALTQADELKTPSWPSHARVPMGLRRLGARTAHPLVRRLVSGTATARGDRRSNSRLYLVVGSDLRGLLRGVTMS